MSDWRYCQHDPEYTDDGITQRVRCRHWYCSANAFTHTRNQLVLPHTMVDFDAVRAAESTAFDGPK